MKEKDQWMCAFKHWQIYVTFKSKCLNDDSIYTISCILGTLPLLRNDYAKWELFPVSVIKTFPQILTRFFYHVLFSLRLTISTRIFIHFINNKDLLTMCNLQTLTLTAAFQWNPVTNKINSLFFFMVAFIDNNVVILYTC